MSGLVSASQTPAAVATIAVSVVAVAIYYYVGFRLARRDTTPSAQLASYQFALWWIGLGAALTVGRLELALALVNALPYALALTCTLVNLVIEAVYLWGLISSLTYIYTGKYHLLWISLAYALLYVSSLYLVFAQMPYGVTLVAGTPSILYGSPESALVSSATQVAVLLPEFVVACLYLSSVRRSRDRRIRFQIALVGASILLWVAVHALLPSSTIDWILLHSVLEVIPAVISLIAILPPAWLRTRLKLDPPGSSEELDASGPARA
jgi:hypothetical protein